MAAKDDLALLPEDVRARARIAANGEVSWPIAEAGTAIDSLADAGLVILGIDVQRYDDQGHTWETAWSDFSATDRYRQSDVGDEAALVLRAGRSLLARRASLERTQLLRPSALLRSTATKEVSAFTSIRPAMRTAQAARTRAALLRSAGIRIAEVRLVLRPIRSTLRSVDVVE